MKRFILLVFTLFILSGCGTEFSAPDMELRADEHFEYDSRIYYAESFSLFRHVRLVSGRFEPIEGTYIGAYIQSDRIVAGDIMAFEQFVGREHSFYTYFLNMGQPFPSEWVLNCIAHMKTPNIVLLPGNIEQPFDEHLLRETARSFGEINVPMFVHFFPVSHSAAFTADEYAAFFRMAREYFNRYASNIALVWAIDAESLHLMERFYPGDDYVDWVGINIFIDSQMSFYEVRLKLDTFYFHFQSRKPIFISQLGISHFTTRNHAYHVAEAIRMMELIFEAIIKDYPRIKAVNYMSFNGLDPVRQRRGIYNFSITDNGHMTRAYAAVIDDAHFLGRVDFNVGGALISQRISHPKAILYYRGDFFIRAHMDIGQNIGINAPNAGAIVRVGAHEYYPLALAVDGMGAIRADFENRMIEIVALR